VACVPRKELATLPPECSWKAVKDSFLVCQYDNPFPIT
jgi:hypothetical protein